MAIRDIRQTRTYAVLEISTAAYAEIAEKLTDAGYNHAFHECGRHGEVIDMHGIAVSAAAPTRCSVSYSHQPHDFCDGNPDAPPFGQDKITALVEDLWDKHIIPHNVDDSDLFKKQVADLVRQKL